MMKRGRALVCVAGLSVGCAASGSSVPVAVNLVQEGMALPGAAGPVVAIRGPRANGVGGYVFGVRTNDGTEAVNHFIGTVTGGPWSVLRTEGTIGDLTQVSFGDNFGFSDTGSIAYRANSMRMGGTMNLGALWVDDTPVVVADVAFTNGNFPAFGSFVRPFLTHDAQLWWNGGETVAPGGSVQIVSLYAVSPDTPVIRSGDLVVGLPDPVDGIDTRFDVSANGTNWIDRISTDTGSTLNDSHVVINGSVAMSGGAPITEDLPIPVSAGGLVGEEWDNFDFFAIAESGDWYASGDTDAPSAMDEILIRNGEIILREGDTVPRVIGSETETITSTVNALAANENGDCVATWYVAPEGGSGRDPALVLNGEVLLKRDDPVDWNGDGVIDAGDEGAFIDEFVGDFQKVDISERRPDGSFDVYFRADISVGGELIEGGFVVSVPAPVCAGDCDGSGTVDFNDLVVMLFAFGPGAPEACDPDGSGVTDFNDLVAALFLFGPCE